MFLPRVGLFHPLLTPASPQAAIACSDPKAALRIFRQGNDAYAIGKLDQLSRTGNSLRVGKVQQSSFGCDPATNVRRAEDGIDLRPGQCHAYIRNPAKTPPFPS